MYKNPYFLEAQLFGSPSRSFESSDSICSPSKNYSSEDQKDIAISNNDDFPLRPSHCGLPWRKLDYPINFDIENDAIYPNLFEPAQLSYHSNLIGNSNIHLGSTFDLQQSNLKIHQKEASIIDGFANLVDRVSSFYIHKLDDGKESTNEFQEDGNILRKTIQKLPKYQTVEVANLARQFDSDWRNIFQKFRNEDGLAKKKTLKRKKIAKEPFSKEEDLEIVKYHQIYKGNWDQIAKFIPNRKAYLIKNRFYSYIRKNLSQLSKELKMTQEKTSSMERDYSTDFSEDEVNLSTGVVESDFLKTKSPSEAIKILSSRISLLTNLYNQTRVELTHLQTRN